MLQVELIWDASTAVPTEPLAADEIPPLSSHFQSKIADFVKQLQGLAEKDLVGLAAELERDLDGFYDATDPERASRFSAMIVRRTGAVLEATGDGNLDTQSTRVIATCARLREAVEGADRNLDDESLALLQVRLADAGAAMASFSASLEGSQTRMNAASAEFSDAFRAVSAAARTWSKKAAGLTTEPRPR
jgi:hypothetical protein